MQLDIQSVKMKRIIIFGVCILGFGIIGEAIEETLESNPIFDKSFYDNLELKMRNYATKLTVDQINELTKYGEDLDALMAAKVKNVLDVDADSISIFDTSDLEILIRGQILNGELDFEEVRFESLDV